MGGHQKLYLWENLWEDFSKPGVFGAVLRKDQQNPRFQAVWD